MLDTLKIQHVFCDYKRKYHKSNLIQRVNLEAKKAKFLKREAATKQILLTEELMMSKWVGVSHHHPYESLHPISYELVTNG